MLAITGAGEMLMAHAISQLATKTSGKESIAMEAFARALRQVRQRHLISSLLQCNVVGGQ